MYVKLFIRQYFSYNHAAQNKNKKALIRILIFIEVFLEYEQ